MATSMKLVQISLLLQKRVSQHLYCVTRNFTGRGIPEKPDCTELDKDGFRIYRIPGLHKTASRYERKRMDPRPVAPAREKRLTLDQEWTDVWPTAAVFNPSVVPLPIRQGYIKNAGENQGVIPDKYHNLELMKITNFLHLTPKHIRKHCAALKKFCTPWPEHLDKNVCRKHFPISITTQDYVYSMSSLRDPRSRKVILKFKLDSLALDEHARSKMIRLVGDRYNADEKSITIEADCCPSRVQNTDYVKYLLTALYYESWKVEPWEKEITWADLDRFEYDKSEAKKKIEEIIKELPSQESEDCKKKSLANYSSAVTRLHECENQETLTQYKNSVKKLLGLDDQNNKVDEPPGTK